jgi:hypothetical protein
MRQVQHLSAAARGVRWAPFFFLTANPTYAAKINSRVITTAPAGNFFLHIAIIQAAAAPMCPQGELANNFVALRMHIKPVGEIKFIILWRQKLPLGARIKMLV